MQYFEERQHAYFSKQQYHLISNLKLTLLPKQASISYQQFSVNFSLLFCVGLWTYISRMDICNNYVNLHCHFPLYSTSQQSWLNLIILYCNYLVFSKMVMCKGAFVKFNFSDCKLMPTMLSTHNVTH